MKRAEALKKKQEGGEPDDLPEATLPKDGSSASAAAAEEPMPAKGKKDLDADKYAEAIKGRFQARVRKNGGKKVGLI